MNEERLDELLRALPPAPQRWVDVAYEVPNFADALTGEQAAEDDDYDEHDTGGADDHWTNTDAAPAYEDDFVDEPSADHPDDPLLQ